MHEADMKPTILVVEDEILVRMYICDALRTHGYNVLEASNADDALRMLDRQADIQLVFTDIRMPGRFDGLDLAHDAEERGLPVVLTSGHLSPDEIPEEMQPLMLKPYRHIDILNAIHEKLTRTAR
jgi:DNA-binding NtrC family response regulator